MQLELQNDFLSEDGKRYPWLKEVLETHEVSANQNRLVQAARSIALPIVHVLIQFSPDDREMGHEPYGSMKAVLSAKEKVTTLTNQKYQRLFIVLDDGCAQRSFPLQREVNAGPGWFNRPLFKA